MNRSTRLDLIACLWNSLGASGESGADFATRAYKKQRVDETLRQLIDFVLWELERHPYAETAEAPAAPATALRLAWSRDRGHQAVPA